MPKASPNQSTFSGGEWGSLLLGRVDSERYKTALAYCENYVPLVQGPLDRRPGSMYVAGVKTNSKQTRLVEFEFSTTQAYIIEFGDQYFRFYRNNGQIESGGSPYEVAGPYLEADLFQLKFTQSADVLYIAHTGYAPRKLTRTAHTSWTLTQIDFLDGPYLSVNTTSTTLTPSGTSGSITLTASAVTGINDNAGFKSTDVGRLVRFYDSANKWTWLKITGFTSTTVVTATVRGPNLSSTTASSTWRLGAWSDTTGWPAAVTFHEDRLCYAGPTDYPQRFDMSKTGDYENFEPTAADGTVADDNALSFSFSSNTVNAIRWIASNEKGLLAGTVGGEWRVSPSSQGEALTPSNISAKQTSSYGSADIEPISIGKNLLFIQRTKKRARELNFFFDVDGFVATDLTVLAPHITGTGIVEMAYQKEPHSIAWAVREDGALVSMTYERDLDALRVGWARHFIGGSSDAAGTNAKVESVAVIPSSDGNRYEVWMVVQRCINGSVVRYVEYLTPFFADDMEQREMFFVDSGLTYDDPKTISGATKASPVVITATGHGFADGDKIYIDNIKGMTQLNGKIFNVANKTTNTFELVDENGVDIDGNAYTTYVSGGTVRKYVSTISGLDHLEGETVSICADGGSQPDKVVSGGAITLAQDATTVHVGEKCPARAKMLPLEAGSADGTAQGKTRRIHRVGFRFDRSLELKIGMDFSDLTPLSFREPEDPMDLPPPLYTGVRSEEIEADYDFLNQICWEQDLPLASRILAVMPQLVTQDR